jgi:ankyrin repeat protein
MSSSRTGTFEVDPGALHLAAVSGDLPRVRALLTAGWDINEFDEFGKTALHYAADEEHLDVVRHLLESGANVNAADARTIGNTPLANVAGSCSLELAQILIAAGADPTIRGWMGLDALYRAGKRVNDEGRRVYELLEKSARR